MKRKTPHIISRPWLLTLLFLLLLPGCASCAEVWEYSVKYLGMTVVRATGQLERISYEGNTEVDHLLLKAKSTRVYSLLYRVDNEYETFVDSNTGYPIRYLRRINEGSIRGNFTTNFDQEREVAIYDSVDEVKLLQKSHDFFSAILFLRRQKLDLGDTYTYNLNVDRYDWEVTVKVTEEKRYKIDKRTLPAKVLEVRFRYLGPASKPNIDTDILTYHLVDERAKLKIFLSDDENRFPLRLEYKLWPFSVKASLNHLPR
ncbi:MAG: DUF3108 domain-containing protein [Candidatus Zixiibacteriota bacterium]|nr:MAG: DUF3108 domain-containing protein [candidate division Zixibacteria bacterium]